MHNWLDLDKRKESITGSCGRRTVRSLGTGNQSGCLVHGIGGEPMTSPHLFHGMIRANSGVHGTPPLSQPCLAWPTFVHSCASKESWVFTALWRMGFLSGKGELGTYHLLVKPLRMYGGRHLDCLNLQALPCSRLLIFSRKQVDSHRYLWLLLLSCRPGALCRLSAPYHTQYLISGIKALAGR